LYWIILHTVGLTFEKSKENYTWRIIQSYKNYTYLQNKIYITK